MKVKLITSNLSTDRLGNRLWVVTKPFCFSVDDYEFTVPQGFVTDGASCPRILWSICAPVAGPFGEGAVIHDWFYNDGPDIGRYNADMVLYCMGKYRGANIVQAQLVKTGVNSFGWMSYKKGIDKMSKDTCYDIVQARLMVSILTLRREMQENV